MVDPVNLNVPGLDYLLLALLFFAVVGLFALVLAPAEVALQRQRRARATERNALLESRWIDGRLEWIAVQGRTATERARKRPRLWSREENPSQERPPFRERPCDLIEEAES